MNKEWKEEQLKFHEKQKQRSAASGAAAIVPIAPKSHVKYPWPYTRDPGAMFQPIDPSEKRFYPVPMNSNGRDHSGVQPIKYSKVMLVCEVGDFSAGTHFESVTVNWLTGQVRLFHTENEMQQGIAAYDDVFRRQTGMYVNMSYVREMLEFLQRGHSLLDPNCRCDHKMDDKRAREVGVTMPRRRLPGEDGTSLRDGKCTLPRARSARTALELSHEIAVGDVTAVTDREGRRLVDDLLNHPSVVSLLYAGEQVFAYRATFESVTCRQELLQLVNQSPVGLKELSEKDTYNGVKKDVEGLAADGEVLPSLAA